MQGAQQNNLNTGSDFALCSLYGSCEASLPELICFQASHYIPSFLPRAGFVGMQTEQVHKVLHLEGPTLSLMFCCCYLEILHNFSVKRPHLHFALELANYVACSDLTTQNISLEFKGTYFPFTFSNQLFYLVLS